MLSMKLFRPVGIKELELIKQSGMRKFPTRLPDSTCIEVIETTEYNRIEKGVTS
jgi:hypothetical protein